MIATATFEKKLTEFYLTAGRNLIRALPRGRQISSPMFLAVREEYETAPRRLFIVGQETNSWYSLLDDLDSEPDALGPIQKLYEDFALGRSHKKSFFCQLMHEIQRKLEPYVPPMGFMWSNLFPCDEKRQTPSDDIADILRRFRLLPNEVAILKPHAIIFLTGPNYDYTISAYFPGASYKEVVPSVATRQLAQIIHPDLPVLSYRTYHPANLRQQRKLQLVDQITTSIKAVWETESRIVKSK